MSAFNYWPVSFDPPEPPDTDVCEGCEDEACDTCDGDCCTGCKKGFYEDPDDARDHEYAYQEDQ